MTELDIQENGIDDLGGDWLSCFPESLTSLEVLNFASLNSEVSFNALEKLVARCKSLRVLKVNRNINLDQLQKLLLRAPQLTELGTGTFTQDLVTRPVADLETTFGYCKNLLALSGLWDSNSLYLPVIYPACASLTFLNLSCATLLSFELTLLLMHCKSLRRLWVTILLILNSLFHNNMLLFNQIMLMYCVKSCHIFNLETFTKLIHLGPRLR